MMEDVQHTQAPLLHVAGLSFSYPQRHVFTHWSHDFSGGLTWIRGSNGSGKSTLCSVLAVALPDHPVLAIDDYRMRHGDGTLAGEERASASLTQTR